MHSDGLLLKTIIIMSVAVLFATGGDILMSRGMKAVGDIKITGLKSLWNTGVRIFTNLMVWGGIGCMASFFFLWLYVLTWADLSLALPMSALTYVLNAFLAKPLLGERVSPMRWAGTLLIFIGVVAVAFSEVVH